MKELSIKEKAKRYDEALEKARKLCTYPTSKPFISDLQELFPELKESEESNGEKIRKHLITLFINDYGKNSNARFAGIKVKDIIAWLEKQGEQKSVWHDKDEEPCEDRQVLICLSGNYYVDFYHKEDKRFYMFCKPKHYLHEIEKWAYLDDLLEKQGNEKDIHLMELKAKAYDDAKKRMSRAYNQNRVHIGFIHEIFPNLNLYENQGELKNIDSDDLATLEIWKDAIKENKEKWQLSDWFVEATSLLIQKVKRIENNESINIKDSRVMLNACINVLRTAGHSHLSNWLEKQGEQKPVEWCSEDEQNLNVCLSYIPHEFLRRWLKDIIHIKYDKPIDMVEPKFHKGEWITIKE